MAIPQGKIQNAPISSYGRDVCLDERLIYSSNQEYSHGAEGEAESLVVDVGLNSVDMVNLMLSLEAEFDLTIPQAEIIPENFQSDRTLEQMITAQLRPVIG